MHKYSRKRLKIAIDAMSWVNYGRYRDWRKQQEGEGQEFLRQATEVKNKSVNI
jgi:aldehyde dehydrogenase (NAD+)